MYLLPKRVKDLPPLEPDSEDDRTPIKPTKEIKNPTIEKLNTLPLRPIRVSELPILSDSEPENDENIMKRILNESFIINTPNQESPSSLKENDKNILNEWDKEKYSKDTGYGDSLAFNIKKVIIDENQLSAIKTDSSDKKQQQNIQTRRPFSFLNKVKLKTIEIDGCSLFNLPEQQKSPLEFSTKNKLPNIFNRIKEKNNTTSSSDIGNYSSKDNALKKKNITNLKATKSLDQYFQINQVLETSNKNNEPVQVLHQNVIPDKKQLVDNLPATFNYIDTPTPYKISEINFITPQVKPTNILTGTRQPINFGSTAQKTRTTNENEYRSQKILFQTPYAVSRPPVSSITNYSISLGLDDTPTAPTDEIKTPTNKNENNINKKSSVELFKSPTKIQNSNTVNSENKSENVTKTNGKKDEKIVLINQKEYSISKKLGSGGSSSVFLAQRKDINKECALKIVDLRGDKFVVEGYLNETKLLAKLQGNINVVSLFEYEHIENKSTLFMVMEKGDSDLYKILQSYKSDLPLYVLMNYLHQILQAVDYIHKNGVIHSDLKPANFLMVNGRLKLIDFGIASRIPNDTTSIIKFSQAGTFNYISPEALIDTSTGNSPCKDQPKIKISTKSDVWSLGCIMYLFLYKKTPFGHIKNNWAKANLISSPDTEIEYPQVSYYYPPMLIEMTKKCLVHNPKKRISVAELLKYPFNMVIPANNL